MSHFDILYYQPPSEEIFEEVKRVCMAIWSDYSNEHGYVDKKHDRIKDLPNVSDNFMYMVAMFDHWNKKRLSDNISQEARHEIIMRIKSGYPKHQIGLHMELNPFMSLSDL